MRTKNKRIFVGDMIITTKTFKPKNKSGKVIDLTGQRYKGMVVHRSGRNYGVRFGEGLEFTDHLNGLLGKPVGYFCENTDFDVVEDL